jgi:hypothetical protein
MTYNLRTPEAQASEKQIELLKRLGYIFKGTLTMKQASDEINRIKTQATTKQYIPPSPKNENKPDLVQERITAYDREKSQKRIDIFASVALQQAVAYWAINNGMPKDIDATAANFMKCLLELSNVEQSANVGVEQSTSKPGEHTAT